MRLSIGELGKATTTKVETIRYYERIGLLPAPSRTAGNYRAYSEAERARLAFIRRARDLGFSLDQVRELIDLSSRREQSCARVDALADRNLAEIERKIADLQALRAELFDIIVRCKSDRIEACGVLAALSP